MYLASVKAIREQLGFDDMTDINAAISGALATAEPFLSSALGTSFSRGIRTDTFLVREPSIYNPGQHETRLKLKHAFVDETPAIGITYYETAQPIHGTGTVFDGTPLIDYERGIVSVIGPRFDKQFIQISYAHGFEVETTAGDPQADPPVPGTPTGSYVIADVPNWLQQAATLYTLLALDTHPVFEETGVKQDTQGLKIQLDQIVRSHSRYEPLAILARG